MAEQPGLIDMVRGSSAPDQYTFPYGGLGSENVAPASGGTYSDQATYDMIRRLAAESNRSHNADVFPSAQFGTWINPDPAYLAERARWSNRNAASADPQFAPSPENAKYFDASGQPRIDNPLQVASDAGITPKQLAAGVFPRYGDRYGGHMQGYDYASDKGGFFKLEDLFGRDPGGNPLTPSIGRAGQGGLSTNNWRLLGMGPGWIMRNGQMIDVHSGGGMWGGSRSWLPNGGLTGEQFSTPTPIGLGTGGAYGVPNLLNYSNSPSMAGWPGAANWSTVTGVLT